MKAVFVRGAGLGLILALSACASSDGPRPAEVTRFHLNQPIARGSIAVEPFDQRDTGDLEFRSYADAVARELARQGWTVVDTPGQSEQVALVSLSQGSREEVTTRSPVSIGVGGSTGGWSSGVGGGISFGLGGNRGGEVIGTMMEVSIKRRSDGTVFWEGRARTEARAGSPAASPAAAADKLASALFLDFPGESARTITVP